MVPANILIAVATVLWSVAGFGASPTATKALTELEQEKQEVDGLLTKVDSVELRKISPRVFRLAGWLLRERGDAAARSYFEKGLEGNPWALDEQLTLGEIMKRGGQADTSRAKAEIVLRLGEDEAMLERACRLIGQPLPPEPIAFSKVEEAGPVLILVPVDTPAPFLLRDLQEALSKRLGMKVVLATIEMTMPKAARTEKTVWLENFRKPILKALQEHPEKAAAELKQMGLTRAQVEFDDAALLAFIQQTQTEKGPEAVQAMNATLARLDRIGQWDAAQIITALQVAIGKNIGPSRLVLGITANDIYSGTSNFLFGAAPPGDFLGIVSTRRFLASFNDEAPKRERLKERLLKQSLSTLGFMLGVPRCNTPECARAFPQSLAEHDQKPSTLCPQCRAAFEKALGQKLPAD